MVEIVTHVNNLQSAAKLDTINEGLLRTFTYGSSGQICPIQAVIGSITAQEVMKVYNICDIFRFNIIYIE